MGTIYHTEDGLAFREGDTVYNYYDMEVITVGRDAGQGWFYYDSVTGHGILNGARACSMEFAQSKGWVSRELMN